MSSMNERELGPVSVRPFHKTYPGMEPLFHTYCSVCPDFGTCGEINDALNDGISHFNTKHSQWNSKEGRDEP